MLARAWGRLKPGAPPAGGCAVGHGLGGARGVIIFGGPGFAVPPERWRVGLVFHRPARCAVIQGAPASPRGAARYDALASSRCVVALFPASFAALRPLLIRLADYLPGLLQRLRI